MVFMKDSERAADLAIRENLETGLHLNLVLPLDASGVPERVKKEQNEVARFFRRGPWTQVIYNPFIERAVTAVFNSQVEEYQRLFGREPAYFNGHKHFHLSLNMIFAGVLPAGAAVRRSFTFYRGEKGLLNRRYRRMVDTWLRKEHVTTDAFFTVKPVDNLPRLSRIMTLAQTASVELMVHPWSPDQYAFLTGRQFPLLIASVPLGGFGDLVSRKEGHSQGS